MFFHYTCKSYTYKIFISNCYSLSLREFKSGNSHFVLLSSELSFEKLCFCSNELLDSEVWQQIELQNYGKTELQPQLFFSFKKSQRRSEIKVVKTLLLKPNTLVKVFIIVIDIAGRSLVYNNKIYYIFSIYYKIKYIFTTFE